MLEPRVNPIQQIEERIAELEIQAEPFREIMADRKLDRWEYPKFRNIQNLIFINKAWLHVFKRDSEHLLQ
jgi:hypothetical protein